MRHALIVYIALLLLALASCSTSLPVRSNGPDAAWRAQQIKELASLPAPSGVKADTWAQLRSALAAALRNPPPKSAASTSTNNAAAAPSSYYDVTHTLSWYYALPGDYDQNGEVNISDLTPLGVHFGQSTGGGP